MPGIGDLLAQRPQEVVGFLGQEEHPLRRVHVGAATRRDQHRRWGSGRTVVVVVAGGGVESRGDFASVPYDTTATQLPQTGNGSQQTRFAGSRRSRHQHSIPLPDGKIDPSSGSTPTSRSTIFHRQSPHGSTILPIDTPTPR